MINTVQYILLSVTAIILLLVVWVVTRSLWAYRVLKVDSLVAYRCKDLSARKKYFESRYDEEFTLIKWRVVKYLRGHDDPHLKETAELLAYVSEPVIWIELTTSSANILFIELDKSANVVQVGDAPADLLKDLERIERAADILGVEYVE